MLSCQNCNSGGKFYINLKFNTLRKMKIKRKDFNNKENPHLSYSLSEKIKIECLKQQLPFKFSRGDKLTLLRITWKFRSH